jgi:hypothetical protein
MLARVSVRCRPLIGAQSRCYNKPAFLKSNLIPNVRMPDFPAPFPEQSRGPDSDSIIDLSTAVDRVAELVEQSNGQLLVMTGAGASTDSGIPDYRSPSVSYR